MGMGEDARAEMQRKKEGGGGKRDMGRGRKGWQEDIFFKWDIMLN